jgi:hypothetical protein
MVTEEPVTFLIEGVQRSLELPLDPIVSLEE